MNRNEKSTMIITTIVCALPILLTCILYEQLPELVPVHFDAQWKVDGYAHKSFAGFGLPSILLALNLVVQFVMYHDPKKSNVVPIVRVIGCWVIPVVSVVVVPLALFIALGDEIQIERIIPSMLALIIILIGNYLPKCRQNYVIGIRLAWTLNNETNWKKTHHLAGYIWVLGGIVLLISTWFQWYTHIMFACAFIAMTIVPVVYSFILFKKGSEKQSEK